MIVLPPGTLLQLMYLREPTRRLPAGRFVEVRPGGGEITQLLLDCGWSGRSYDLDSRTIAGLRKRFAEEIGIQRFLPVDGDFLVSTVSENADLVISSMVMEHLTDEEETAFMIKSKSFLKPGGLMLALVPASPEHWGIEDDVAGH